MTVCVYSGESIHTSGFAMYTSKHASRRPLRDQSLHGIHVLLHHPGACYKTVKNASADECSVCTQDLDLHTIACEGALQHGASYVSRRPSSQQFVALRVDVCRSDCDAMVSSSLPHGGLFAQAFDSFCYRHKTVATCFYTWMVSGIFDLAKFAFFMLRKHHFVSLLHYF
jgi:hypothetical protein